MFIALSSCSKVKLEGDRDVLVGNWEWEYSVIKNNTCDNSQYWYDTITPNTENKNYQIEFLKQGRVKMFENSSKTRSSRITSCTVNLNSNSGNPMPHAYSVHLSGSSSLNLFGNVGSSELSINNGFPFDDPDCENFTNYFVRK